LIRDPQSAALVHSVFEYLAIGIGMALYRQARRRQAGPALLAPGSFAVLVGLLVGAGIGNKLASAIQRPEIFEMWKQGQLALPGQSIVGGLLGGLIGVELAKRFTGQSRSTGDAMVLPIAVGIMIGRVGCFFAGLHDDTYGVPTTLPWGVDFGDGAMRHATQLYDVAFVGVLASTLSLTSQHWSPVPGLQFKLFLAGYLLWRLIVDALKPVPVGYAWGLSGIQWMCLLALAFYAPPLVRALSRRSRRAVLHEQ
jgi:phosphatidylglycerol---prolipoprotein diacylglyceryl transferase